MCGFGRAGLPGLLSRVGSLDGGGALFPEIKAFAGVAVFVVGGVGDFGEEGGQLVVHELVAGGVAGGATAVVGFAVLFFTVAGCGGEDFDDVALGVGVESFFDGGGGQADFFGEVVEGVGLLGIVGRLQGEEDALGIGLGELGQAAGFVGGGGEVVAQELLFAAECGEGLGVEPGDGLGLVGAAEPEPFLEHEADDLEFHGEDDLDVFAGPAGIEGRAEEIGGEAGGEGLAAGLGDGLGLGEGAEQGEDGAGGLVFGEGLEPVAGAEVELAAFGIDGAAELVDEVLEIAAVDDEEAQGVAVAGAGVAQDAEEVKAPGFGHGDEEFF